MNKEETTQIELDAAAVEAIAAKVMEGVKPAIEETTAKAVETAMTTQTEQLEKIVQKNVAGGSEEVKVSKEKRFIKAAMALVTKNTSALVEYNTKSLEAREKAGYANSDIAADGGYIVADPEFEAEIEKLANVYGVAFTEATVRTTDRESIKTNKRGSNVAMYEIGAGVKKPATKIVIEQVTVTLRKFAAIAVAVDELVEDAAIDFWSDVAEGFAEERGRWADVLVFTDQTVGLEGVLHAPGVAIESVGSAITSITWDNLMNAEVKVPTVAMMNGKHYMHRTVWNVVRKSKDSEGRYQLMPEAGLTTPWGTPVRLVDVLPSVTQGDSNEPYTVFGDLKRVRLYVKRGLVLDVSNDAQITDVGGSTINLFEQDMTALRAVSRMVAMVKFPEAFCVIGTGGVS